MNYYNEHDHFAAQWLRTLMSEGLIPVGDVDERSIEDVLPRELAGYKQCHFFAGIGGWSLALRIAGVRSDLETLGYAVGAADLCAAGVGSPHQRQRLFWLADAQCERRREWPAGGRDVEYVTGTGEDVWCGEYGRCADGKQRRVPPGVPLLVNGFPNRVEQMRGFGNAIVPQVAAEFLRAAL